ncbi:enoyl-CoA hydratase [Geothermobacter ehrlichii]|uniref:Enoyl-CoA hydratase n=1 Tax=Geothermobacter ehrlichii TaxID=213224 RepID=A0A5D3WED0_9BACT|nr:enoyl-CoA hydratase-related protein [Geothermobacter ehrlichii]TYO95256.1 enoyl-CoA hydratase [Geothermobacter ehrlichii]
MAFVELRKENRLGIVTINRPKALNALNTQVLAELEQTLREIAVDDKIGVIIITGAGEKAFVAGADIVEMQNKSAEAASDFARKGQNIFRLIQDLPQPTIAAVNGFALGGGCELAMACDLRLASENARFGQPEVNLGIIPGFGGTQRLPRLIGRARAMELILTGRTIKAEEALELGLVNKVVPSSELLNEAVELAKTILVKGPEAVRRAKSAVNKGLEIDTNTGCELEATLFGLCFAGKEQKEGMAAFLEKRTANFIQEG